MCKEKYLSNDIKQLRKKKKHAQNISKDFITIDSSKLKTQEVKIDSVKLKKQEVKIFRKISLCVIYRRIFWYKEARNGPLCFYLFSVMRSTFNFKERPFNYEVVVDKNTLIVTQLSLFSSLKIYLLVL